MGKWIFVWAGRVQAIILRLLFVRALDKCVAICLPFDMKVMLINVTEVLQLYFRHYSLKK